MFRFFFAKISITWFHPWNFNKVKISLPFWEIFVSLGFSFSLEIIGIADIDSSPVDCTLVVSFCNSVSVFEVSSLTSSIISFPTDSVVHSIWSGSCLRDALIGSEGSSTCFEVCSSTGLVDSSLLHERFSISSPHSSSSCIGERSLRSQEKNYFVVEINL